MRFDGQLKRIRQKEEAHKRKVHVEAQRRAGFFRKLSRADKLLREVDQLKRRLSQDAKFSGEDASASNVLKQEVVLMQLKAR